MTHIATNYRGSIENLHTSILKFWNSVFFSACKTSITFYFLAMELSSYYHSSCNILYSILPSNSSPLRAFTFLIPRRETHINITQYFILTTLLVAIAIVVLLCKYARQAMFSAKENKRNYLRWILLEIWARIKFFSRIKGRNLRSMQK